MEIIFLAMAAGVGWLYLFSPTVCYSVVGGGYLTLVIAMLISRVQKSRKLKVGIESAKALEGKARVTPFPRVKELGNF